MPTTRPAFADNDVKKFSDDARRIIAFARILGWQIKWGNQSKRMAILSSPPPTHKEINIPTTNVNVNRIRSWLNQITTHSDPMAVTNLVRGGIDLVREPDIARLVATYGTQLVETYGDMQAEEAAVGRLPETEQEKQQVREHQTAIARAMAEAQEAQQREAKVIEMPTQEVTPSNEERVPIAVRPWLARKSGSKGKHGKVYESMGVMVATFEDGTETFQCRFCTFMNDNPRSVKMHAAQKHPQNRRPQTEATMLDTDNYQPSDEKRSHGVAVRRLTNDLIAALDSVQDWQAMEITDLAHTVATHIIDNRPERVVNPEPLTDEQVLRRIEALVDRGKVADLHRQVDALTERLRQTSEDRDEATARADRAVGNLNALREMLSEES